MKTNTIKAYLQSINRLNTLSTDSEFKNLDFLKKHENIVKLVSKYQPTTRKNLYNSAVVALQSSGYPDDLIQQYSDLRDEEHNKYKNVVSKNEKTDKQKANWLTLKDIDKLLKKLKLDFDDVYDKYRDDIKITKRDILRAQDYIVLLIHRGIPLRNNLANLKIVQKTDIPSDSKENYIVRENKKFYFLFQNYKTDKTFGKKKLYLTVKLQNILKISFG